MKRIDGMRDKAKEKIAIKKELEHAQQVLQGMVNNLLILDRKFRHGGAGLPTLDDFKNYLDNVGILPLMKLKITSVSLDGEASMARRLSLTVTSCLTCPYSVPYEVVEPDQVGKGFMWGCKLLAAAKTDNNDYILGKGRLGVYIHKVHANCPLPEENGI